MDIVVVVIGALCAPTATTTTTYLLECIVGHSWAIDLETGDAETGDAGIESYGISRNFEILR